MSISITNDLNIYWYILIYMRNVDLKDRKLTISESVERIIEKRVEKFGSGGHMTLPKEFVGKRVYAIIIKD